MASLAPFFSWRASAKDQLLINKGVAQDLLLTLSGLNEVEQLLLKLLVGKRPRCTEMSVPPAASGRVCEGPPTSAGIGHGGEKLRRLGLVKFRIAENNSGFLALARPEFVGEIVEDGRKLVIDHRRFRTCSKNF